MTNLINIYVIIFNKNNYKNQINIFFIMYKFKLIKLKNKDMSKNNHLFSSFSSPCLINYI